MSKVQADEIVQNGPLFNLRKKYSSPFDIEAVIALTPGMMIVKEYKEPQEPQ